MTGRFLFWVCGALLLPHAAAAKELLSEAVIASYLDEANPYVYTALGQQYVAQAKVETAEGGFDTRLGAKYDNKRYPASEGELADIYVEKATESGLEFLLGYRKAEGVQEYSNIKTGDEGEMRVGVKIPLFSVLNGMNERRYRLETASLDAAQSEYRSQDNLRRLRFEVYASYYRLLHRRALAALEADLLRQARQRTAYVRSRVDTGEAAEMTLLEMRRQILNREQRLLEAENGYETALGDFLRYLGLSRGAFDARYTLPPLPDRVPETMALETALQRAWETRPDLMTLQYEKARFGLQEAYNSVSQYPRLKVALYGVHDFKYDNGAKVSVEMAFPIERRQYSGRKREIDKGVRALDETLQRKRIDIETGLSNRLKSLQMLAKNRESARAEVALARQLESAEMKKYRLGASDLLRVNTREVITLQARQTLLSYQLRLLLIGLEIERETGVSIASGEPALLE